MTALRAAVGRVQAVWVRLQHQATMDRVSIDRHVANGNEDLAQPYRAMAVEHDADADALALVLRALSERAWQPIATAPLDGTVVMLARDMGEPWGWVRGWGEHFQHGRIVGWIARGFYDPPGELGLAHPTHWQPLPDPPVDLAPALAEER